MATPPAKATSLPRESQFKAPTLSSSRSYPSLLSLVQPNTQTIHPTINPSTPLTKTAPLNTICEGLPPLSPQSISQSATLSSNQSVAQSTCQKSSLADLTRLGNACFATGQFDRAIALYTQALELNISDACLWSNRGTAYVRLALYKMGVRDYIQAIELFPQCGEFYYQRGVAYSALKQYDQAISDYSSCVKLLPKHANSYNNRGNAYRIMKNYSAALADLKQACKLEPTSTLYQKNLQRIEQAMQSINQSLTQSPSMMSTPTLAALPQSPKLPLIQLTVDTTLSNSQSPTQHVQSIYQSINQSFNRTTSPLSPASPPILSHLPPQFIETLLQMATHEQQSKKRKRSIDESINQSVNDQSIRDAICLYQLRSLSPNDDYSAKKMRVTGLDAHSQHLLYDDDDEDEDSNDESSGSEGSESPDARHQLSV